MQSSNFTQDNANLLCQVVKSLDSKSQPASPSIRPMTEEDRRRMTPKIEVEQPVKPPEVIVKPSDYGPSSRTRSRTRSASTRSAKKAASSAHRLAKNTQKSESAKTVGSRRLIKRKFTPETYSRGKESSSASSDSEKKTPPKIAHKIAKTKKDRLEPKKLAKRSDKKLTSESDKESTLSTSDSLHKKKKKQTKKAYIKRGRAKNSSVDSSTSEYEKKDVARDTKKEKKSAKGTTKKQSPDTNKESSSSDDQRKKKEKAKKVTEKRGRAKTPRLTSKASSKHQRKISLFRLNFLRSNI